MSIRLMGAVFELEIPAMEKLVLLAMSDHARDDGTGCYPSIDRLAKKSSLSRRGVQKIVRRLEGAGFIKPTGNVRGGRNLATEYRITLEKSEPGSLFSSAKGGTPGQKRANLSAQKGEPGSPQPSGTVIEPETPAASQPGYPRHNRFVRFASAKRISPPAAPMTFLPEIPFQKRDWTMEDVCPKKS